MRFKLRITFERLSFPYLLDRAHTITTALTSEPALTLIPDPWPACYPSRAQLTTAFTEFKAALMASFDGGRRATSARDEKRAVLIRRLKDLAPYLESVAKAANDVTLLHATGYKLWQKRAAVAHPLAAPVLKLRRSTLSGVLIAKASRVNGAGSYETQICTGDPTVEINWTHAVTATGCLRIPLTGLTPGRVYCVRVRAIGGRGPGAWSPVARLMAV